MKLAAQNVQVRIAVFNTAAEQWEYRTETWYLTGKLGRCSAPLVRTPGGTETEVYPASGVVSLSRADRVRMGMGCVSGEGARVINWTM